MTRRRAAVPLSLLLVAVVLAACRSAAPERELQEAIRATAASSFAYEVSAEADRAALEQLGEAAADAAGFLAAFRIEGIRDSDGVFTAAVDIGGTAPLLDVHATPDRALLLRTGLPELLGIAGRDPGPDVLPALRDAGLSETAQDAVVAAFAGEWLEVTDAEGAGDLLGGDATPAAAPDPLSAVRVLGARDTDDGRRFDVEVEMAALGRQLGLPLDGLADVAPGVVTTRNGVVTEAVLEIGTRQQAEDDDASPTLDLGSGVRIVLRLSGHGEQEAPQAPTAAAAVTQEELRVIAEQLGASAP